MKKNSVNTSPATLVVALTLAFVIGGVVTWLAMRPHNNPLHAQSAPSLASASMPPDVTGLSPADAAVKLANWNYDQGNWALAIEHYEQAIRLGSATADIRTDLGNCYRFTGQTQKALEQYQTAQRLNPQHEQSLFNTAGLYGEILHDHAKAAEAWRVYLARFPDGPGAVRARHFLADSESRDQELKQLFNENRAAQP